MKQAMRDWVPGARVMAGVLGAVAVFPMLTSCVMEQTVTDGSGNVIYQEDVVEKPFESGRRKEADVEKREQALGW